MTNTTQLDTWRLRLAQKIAGQQIQLASVTAKVDDSAGWQRHGFSQNERDLAESQQLYTDTLEAWRKNPIAKRITDITADYVLGDGFKFSSEFQPLNDFYTQFWHHPKNQLDHRLSAMSDELARAGDLFPVLFRNPSDGLSYIRFVVKPEIIKIQTRPKDWETEITYHQQTDTPDEPRVWPSIHYPNSHSKNAIMLHYHINRPIGALLGEPDLASMIPWLLRYSRMLEDRVRLHWAARAFLWVVTAPTNRIKEKQHQYRNPPESGSIIVKDAAETWEAITPNLRGADAAHDMAAVRGMIDAGSGYPPHWRGEASSANLATASAMQGPAERHLRRRQRYFEYMLRDIILTAYRRQSNPTPLPKLPDTELLHAHVTEISRDDNLELAQAANQLSATYAQLHIEKPQSQTLLRKFLELTFKFAGEPQNDRTIQTIMDEINRNATATAEASQ